MFRNKAEIILTSSTQLYYNYTKIKVLYASKFQDKVLVCVADTSSLTKVTSDKEQKKPK